MLQRNILLMFFLLTLGSSAQALNSIDSFIRDRCARACIGESDECRVCYNRAVDLFQNNISF